jgi:ATP-dependent DNA helicase RecG
MYISSVVSKRTANALLKKNIYTTDDFVRFFPKKYYDLTTLYDIQSAPHDIVCAIRGRLISVRMKGEYGKKYIQGEMIDEKTETPFSFFWFGNYYGFRELPKYENMDVVICGMVAFSEQYGYSVKNPISLCAETEFTPRIEAVERKISGVSAENYAQVLKTLLTQVTEPYESVSRNISMGYKDAVTALHFPKSFEEIRLAKNRLALDDLLYFALRMRETETVTKSDIKWDKHVSTESFIQNLPYELTPDQQSAVDSIMHTHNRINALIQGDVSCGKTIVAIIAMFLCAENGYQAVLMAPKKVLAVQHYKEVYSYAEKMGYTVVFLRAGMTAKEKREAQKLISSGEANIIVGTHSCLNYEYKNLGLVVIDEEHIFGTKQKESFVREANRGIHFISMSATPIPRTIAGAVYGESREIIQIKSMPKGRIPIQTAICNNRKLIFDFMEKQIALGHQCYVVCPAIEENEKMLSVESMIEEYKKFFEPRGRSIGVLTGKCSKEENEQIMTAFSKNKLNILMSTTVIEVGVNIPNATVIAIEQAENFGLASLHQLRGRVGRSSYKSYCILSSMEKQNPRLVKMTQTTNGFEIAEADLELRGSGNLIGEKQSGYNHYVDLILSKPDLYAKAKKLADELTESEKLALVGRYKEHEELEENL